MRNPTLADELRKARAEVERLRERLRDVDDWNADWHEDNPTVRDIAADCLQAPTTLDVIEYVREWLDTMPRA